MKEDPWDMSPVNQSQLSYIRQLLERLSAADFSKLDTTRASGCIDKLNSVRRAVGVKFEPMDGLDSDKFS